MGNPLLQKFIDAKLAGYLVKDAGDGQPAYRFRTNEQAAELAERIARVHYEAQPSTENAAPTREGDRV